MRSFRRGFSLVELLVVLGIVALAIGILVPALTKARESGQRAACLSNVRQLALRAIMYAQDNHGAFPLEGRNLQFNLLDPGIFRGDMFALFKLPDKVWQCPSLPTFSDMYSVEHGSMYGWMPGQPWPASQNIPNKQTSYLYLANGYNLPNNSYELDPSRRPANLNAKDPTTKTLFADSVQYFVYAPGYWIVNHNKGTRADAVAGGNQSFVDGHAEWITLYPDPLNGNYPGGNASLIHWTGVYNQPYWW